MAIKYVLNEIRQKCRIFGVLLISYMWLLCVYDLTCLCVVQPDYKASVLARMAAAMAKFTCTIIPSLVPRPSEGGGERKAWYLLHAHALLLFRF